MSAIYDGQFVLNLEIDDQLLYEIVSKFLVDHPEKKNIQWKTVATEYTKAKNLVIGVQNLAYKDFIKKLQKSYRKTKKKKNGETKTMGEGETKTTGESETGEGETKTTGEGVVRVPEDYGTLEEAVEMVHGDDGLTTIVLGRGKHIVVGFASIFGIDKRVQIASAMNIVGDPGVDKEEVVVMGGIWIREGIQGNCHLQNLTLRGGEESGVNGQSSFTMEDVLVEECEHDGVYAYGEGGVGKCTNVEVRQCEYSGVFACNGGSITLIGAKTKVHNNCTQGYSNDHYGLRVVDRLHSPSSTIQLVSPLTKEQVSFANGGGGNWGATEDADISQIKTIFERVPETEVRVPEDYKTLKEAVARVEHDSRITTIVLGEGEHEINSFYLEISSAMNIVGDPKVPKSEIVVVGGILFKPGIQGNCHLQHLTLRQAMDCGVRGWSSFTMEDVLVEQCRGSGVWAYGAGVVGRCTNVEVSQCEDSGVVASSGASTTLIGAKTTVHHNCTKGGSGEYGLAVYGSTSTIKLVSPLTKEQVSLDNGGGGNCGAANGGDINQIRSVLPPSIQPLYTQLFAACAGRYEQLSAFGNFSETRTYHPRTVADRMVGILRKLKSQGQLYINYKNEQGLSMLTTACVNGQIQMIKALMEMPQIDGTMTREQFIRCTAFPHKWLNGEVLNHTDTITLDETIGNCPVRCLPCRHPFEAIKLLKWLGGTVDFVDNPQRREPHTKCPGCNSEVQNVELMSSDLVTRWNTMDRNFIEAEKVLRNKNSSPSEREEAERVRKINNYPSRYRQFVKTKL
jgi:hypothetical protein